MTWTWKFRKEHQKLQAEVKEAREQLKRAEKADSRINKLHRQLRDEVGGNHMGERLRLHFEQSRRRPDHGNT